MLCLWDTWVMGGVPIYDGTHVEADIFEGPQRSLLHRLQVHQLLVHVDQLHAALEGPLHGGQVGPGEVACRWQPHTHRLSKWFKPSALWQNRPTDRRRKKERERRREREKERETNYSHSTNCLCMYACVCVFMCVCVRVCVCLCVCVCAQHVYEYNGMCV